MINFLVKGLSLMILPLGVNIGVTHDYLDRNDIVSLVLSIIELESLSILNDKSTFPEMEE